MRRLLVLVVLGALILAAGATAATAYVHWEGRYFSAFLPAKSWRVVENQNGIDITSPVGDEYVSFGYAGNAPSLPTLSQVRALVVRALGFRNVRILEVGAPYSVGSIATAGWRNGTLFYLALVFPVAWRYLVRAEALNRHVAERPARVLGAIALSALLLVAAAVNVSVGLARDNVLAEFLDQTGRVFVMAPFALLVAAETLRRRSGR